MSLYYLPLELQLDIFVISNNQIWKRVCSRFYEIFEANPYNFMNNIFIACIKKCKIENIPINELKKIENNMELLIKVMLNSEQARKFSLEYIRNYLPRYFSWLMVEEDIWQRFRFTTEYSILEHPWYLEYIETNKMTYNPHYFVIEKQINNYSTSIITINKDNNQFINYLLDLCDNKSQNLSLLHKIISAYDMIYHNNDIINIILDFASENNNFSLYQDIYEIYPNVTQLFPTELHYTNFIIYDNINALKFFISKKVMRRLYLNYILTEAIKHNKNNIYNICIKKISDDNMQLMNYKIIEYINLSIKYNNIYVFINLLNNKKNYINIKYEKCNYYNKRDCITTSYLKVIHESCKVSKIFMMNFFDIIKKYEGSYSLNLYKNILLSENPPEINNKNHKKNSNYINKKEYNIKNKIVKTKIIDKKNKIYQKKYR